MYNQIDSNKRNSVILVLTFFIILIGLGYAFDYFYGTAEFPYFWLMIGVAISFFMTLISYFQGDKIALYMSGAKQIGKEENKYVFNMVENLCLTAGVPVPKVYIIEDSSINAFATGRKPAVASIAVTRGAIEKLANEELEGVIAHELSHIGNYDIRFMTLVAVLVGAIAILADMFWRIGYLGRHRSSSNDRGGGNSIVLIVGIVMVILSPIVAELIKLAISRKREYLADASGALLTRYPEGLARALEKIGQENQPLKIKSTATAHLFIANPFASSKLKSIFSTHPPIEERIKKLRSMA
ncbi:MAG: M48 family metallopeptidase [Patescibacteria group bacterium]